MAMVAAMSASRSRPEDPVMAEDQKAGPLTDPSEMFSTSPFRHTLDAAFGTRPHPLKAANPQNPTKVHDPDMRASFKGAAPIIGIDTEYVEEEDNRNRILSYQFAVIAPEGTWRGIIYCEDGERLTLAALVGHALEVGVRDKVLKKWPSEVVLAAHHSNAEMAAFADFAKLKTQFDGIRKTFATVKSAYKARYTDLTKHKRHFEVSLVDTQHLTPGGKGLKILGNLYKFPKVELPRECNMGRMDLVLRKFPEEFESYAIRDAEISAFHTYRMREFVRDR